MQEVNIMVPSHSPLRYPGGKTVIAPLVKLIIKNTDIKDCVYIEPFAGGAGVALSLLFDNTVSKIVINDFDIAIYSFWKAILENTESFIELINRTPLSIEEWNRQKNIYTTQNDKYSLELGFATFYLNRTNRSGILKAGPIGGKDQTGNYLLDARYNKAALIEKIEKIAERKNDIFVYNEDVIDLIDKYIPQFGDKAFVYFDPPYFNKGKELYKNFFAPEDHKRIAEHIKNNHDYSWIVTYDNVEQIRELYKEYTIKTFELTYSIGKSKKGTEIIVFKKNSYCPDQETVIANAIKVELR